MEEVMHQFSQGKIMMNLKRKRSNEFLIEVFIFFNLEMSEFQVKLSMLIKSYLVYDFIIIVFTSCFIISSQDLQEILPVKLILEKVAFLQIFNCITL